ncbi:uncharacterized protein BX664DRAFT_321052 [Halteromyces radiatus]|uniref:uncharacterized protein n=1 Tax=Halteromyces radiatus TaxID=101107 RepID=UPI00222048B9|nr:uncharacterized protein BX664DRAFT_321052 [Halteromyces radiatus]KAI8099347.1 hypothetical protein BX664DRAFT_321052 [Halteromyces radiatus]
MLFYVVMFQRLIILESDRHSRWIKLVGLLLIGVRFADWPYELIAHQLNTDTSNSQSIFTGGSCWAQWQLGVLIVNFIGDAVANIFLSGMFVRRLYKHIRSTQSSGTPQNKMISYIARKSLLCLILTFFVNLAMNLLKVTTFLGEYSDAFTVFFELAESTLLVEALRVDDQLKATVGCSQCGKSSGRVDSGRHPPPSQKRSMLAPFGSFDFVPLEERQSPNDPFRYQPSNHPISSSSSTGRRVTYSDDDTLRMRSSMDPPTTSTKMDTTGYVSTKNNDDDNDDFLMSPTKFAQASPLTSPPPTQLHHHHHEANDIVRPLDTLSSSLVYHPEWNSNDYRTF